MGGHAPMSRRGESTRGISNPLYRGEKMKEVQGFPLAETTTFSMMGKSKTTRREAVEVKQGPVDPAAFALLAGDDVRYAVNVRLHDADAVADFSTDLFALGVGTDDWLAASWPSQSARIARELAALKAPAKR